MPINFPNSPSPSQLYSYDNKTWEWNGTYWEVYSALTSYVGGTGTTQTISKWSGVNTLTDSQIYDDGTQVNIGGSQILGSLFSVVGTVGVNEFQIQATSGSIGITDNDLTSWSTGGGEVAIGLNAPLASSTGSNNVAIGSQSMASNTSGGENVAVGRRSLLSNQTGQGNVAIGLQAGNGVTSGSYNVFIGYQAGEGSVTTQDNKLHIANTNTKTLIYGEFDNDFVGIGGALSAVTYQNLPGSSSANCFTTFYVTNISGCSPVNILSPLNVTDGLSVTGTSTFASQVNFTGGISASTFSASTYQNLPVSAVTAGSGISASTSNGVATITNTDRGSSQNIFKNIQVGGVTQFSAGSNSANLNFSGVNITITSAATNTLVFSAGTGGGSGTVTSVTLAAGTTGTDVNISNPTVTTSGTITLNIPDASSTARGLITTGTQTIAGNKTINGALTTTGDTTAFSLVSSQSVGDEGGEIRLATPVTNTTLSGTSVTIDIYQNKIRIFESGSPNRGTYIDLTTAFSGVGSNLLPSLRKTDCIETGAFTASAVTTVKSFFIPANTVGAGDIVVLTGRLRKSGSTSSLIARFYASTSTTPGGSLLGAYSMSTNASTYLEMTRNLAIVSATNNTAVPTTGVNLATGFINTSVSTTTVNWTNDVYLLLTYSLGSSGDNVYGVYFDVEIRKYNP